MAVTRDFGHVVFICDDCGDHFETGEKDFDFAKDMMQSSEWETVNEDGEWKNYCPTCKNSGGYIAG